MERHVELLILGAGCAGLTAGIYGARAGKETVILERGIPGGQAARTAVIDNYPGVPGVDGVKLMQSMAAQAKSFGVEIEICEVQSLDARARRVQTDSGDFTADAIIVALGADMRRLGIPGEGQFTGKGVSYCASCDGFFYRGKKVYVVGGGNSAGEEALHLAEIGCQVELLVRRGAMRCEAHIAEKVLHHPRITVHFHTELAEISGEWAIETVILRDTQTGAVSTQEASGSGVFIFAGYVPATGFLAGQVALDEGGYVVTDGNLQTSVPGIFAAGDVRQKPLRQIVTAASDGAEAAFQACKFCADVISS